MVAGFFRWPDGAEDSNLTRITRGPAVLATIAALALVNLGLASLIASAAGAREFIPAWLAVLLLLSGVVAGAVAATLWRGYLNSVHTR